jgi:glycolate oxidase FAD binding subunit
MSSVRSRPRIHPQTKRELVAEVRRANAEARRVLVIGGGRHLDKGNPSDVDAELWTTQLDALVSYEPAEMVAVVEAGMRVGDLRRVLADGGQEWPADAPDDATVGGVIASAASSARRLKVGPLRDTVLEAEVVTGDGRFVRSGARTVKNVTGYDVHKLVAGSLGTLGVIAQVALKVRPIPERRRTLRFHGDMATAAALVDAVPAAAGVVAMPDGVELRLEGWSAEVEEQARAAMSVAEPTDDVDDAPFPWSRPWEGASVVAEVAVTPSRLADVLEGERWGALVGVGIAWVGLDRADGPLETLRRRVREAGGIAPVIRGRGGLGDDRVPAPEVQRRLKAAFDPNGVLAPGRGWGAI